MQRLSVVNELKGSFKQAQKDMDLKSKAINLKMQELSDKYLMFYIELARPYQRALSILKNTKFTKDFQN